MSTLTPQGNLTVSVKSCARCQQDHKDVVFTPFSVPPHEASYTHWAMCPTVKEPILMVAVNK